MTAGPPDDGTLLLTGETFQQASLSMSVHDTRQRYLRVNDTARRMLGLPQENVIGRRLSDVMEEIDADGAGFMRHLREVTETGRSLRYETYTPASSRLGEHAWTVEMWPVRDASDQVTAVAVAGFETTAQRRASQRLALLNEAAAGIGTTLDVVRTAEELIAFLVPRFADFASVDLLEWVLGTEEPIAAPTAGIALRRVAHDAADEGSPGPPCTWARPMSTRRTRHPPGRWPRGGRCCPDRGIRTSTGGCGSATSRPRTTAPIGNASAPPWPCR